jgi:hypothetical protein
VRKIIVPRFLSLGGWTVPYFDELPGNTLAGQMGHPFDFSLGRKTFEILAPYWLQRREEDPEINRAPKHMVSKTSPAGVVVASVKRAGDVETGSF